MRTNRETEVVNYRNTHKYHIVTTRFNNDTKMENDEYRKRITNTDIKCIYSSCSLVDGRIIKPMDIMFVIEMNNSINNITGIGMVRNCVPKSCNIHNIYKITKHNMFAYSGKHHIDRSEMTESEEKIMRVLEIMCFTGSRHQKRSQGLTVFPVCMLQKCKSKGKFGLNLDVSNFIGNMFSGRFFGSKPNAVTVVEQSSKIE